MQPWIQQIIDKIIPTAPPVPGEPISLPFRLERGSFRTTERKPYRVTFSQPYPEPPTVICAGGARSGKIEPYSFRVKKITAPKVGVPAVPVVSLPSKPTFVPLSFPTLTLPTLSHPSITPPTVSLKLPSLPSLKVPTGSEIVDYIVKVKVPVVWRGSTYRVWWLKFGDPAAPTIDGRKWSALALAIDAAAGYAWWCDDILPSLGVIADTFSAFGEFWDTYIGGPIIKKVNEAFTSLTDTFSDTKTKVEGYISDLKSKIETWSEGLKAEITSKVNAGWSTIQSYTSRLSSEVSTKLNPVIDEIRNAVDRIKSSLEPAFLSLKTEVDSKLNALGTELSRFSDEANYIWEGLADEVIKGLTKGIEGIYNMVGIREGVLLTPVAVSEVTRDGFTIEGTENGVYYWMAVGRSE